MREMPVGQGYMPCTRNHHHHHQRGLRTGNHLVSWSYNTGIVIDTGGH
jgi:hypothetical protein